MQDEDDEWGAFGAAADHTPALDPADHPRDVPTAQGEGTDGVKGGDDGVVDRVEDDDDFADFEAAPATPTQEDADDEFGDFAEQPPQPAAGTQPEPVRADGGDEDGFGDFADFDEAPAPPSPPPPPPPAPVPVAVGSARDLAALRGDDFTAGCAEALGIAFPRVPGRDDAKAEYGHVTN